MSATKDGRVKIAGGVHVREFDGEMVVLDLERGEYFGLDELGAQVWKELVVGIPAEIASALDGQYDVEPERLVADIVALTSDLLARGLVVSVQI